MKFMSSFILTSIAGILLFQSIAGATQVQSSNAGTGLKYSSINALLHASVVVQFTLLILIALSVLCWAIAWTKYNEMKNLREENKAFSEIFWKTTSLDELFEKRSVYSKSSFARIFKDVYTEMKKIADAQSAQQASATAGASGPQTTENQSASIQLHGIDNLERTIRKTSENEVAQLESKLSVLASTGSTGPFIGLFGTVWGILTSFEGIAKTGSASLATVAPGISEALIATAIGLAAAIPAVLLYNYFVGEIRREEIEMNNFGSDLLNILKRNFFKA